jgi:hypothetical protein
MGGIEIELEMEATYAGLQKVHKLAYLLTTEAMISFFKNHVGSHALHHFQLWFEREASLPVFRMLD